MNNKQYNKAKQSLSVVKKKEKKMLLYNISLVKFSSLIMKSPIVL